MKYFKLSSKYPISIQNKGGLSEDQILQSNHFYSKYIEQYTKRSGIELPGNPYRDFIFKTSTKAYDIYRDPFVGRGFIVSQKLKEIILKRKLPKHSVFEDLKYFTNGILMEDLSYIHFYESCFDFIDFRRSTFALTPIADRSYIRNVIDDVHQFKIVGKIEVDSLVDFETKRARYYGEERLDLICVDMCLPPFEDYDLITLYFLSDTSYYISQRLREEIESKNVKGCDFSFPHFKFLCN